MPFRAGLNAKVDPLPLRVRPSSRHCMKLPRDVSGESLCRALARMGYVRMGQTGSHVKLKNGSRTVTVPAHASIAPGTLANILRQANVDLEELLPYLR